MRNPDHDRQGGSGKKDTGPGDGIVPAFAWDDFYGAARKIGLAPSEFWNMTMPEFFLEIDIARADAKGGDVGTNGQRYAGGLKQSQVDYLREWMTNGYRS